MSTHSLEHLSLIQTAMQRQELRSERQRVRIFIALLRSPHQYMIKSAFLLAGGCIAGFVASQIKGQSKPVRLFKLA